MLEPRAFGFAHEGSYYWAIAPHLRTALNNSTLHVTNVSATYTACWLQCRSLQPTAADTIRCHVVYGLTNNYTRKGWSWLGKHINQTIPAHQSKKESTDTATEERKKFRQRNLGSNPGPLVSRPGRSAVTMTSTYRRSDRRKKTQTLVLERRKGKNQFC